MLSAEDAMRQAWMTSSEYASNTLDHLARLLGIDRSKAGWQEKLAPFAVVWAAMIRAAAEDFDTAIRSKDAG